LDKFRDEFGLAGGGSGAGPSEISAVGRCARSGCLMPFGPGRSALCRSWCRVFGRGPAGPL